MLIRLKKAQSTLEYALIVAVAAGALISMQVYIKRGLQGKLKAATDEIGEQYSPGNTTSVTEVNIVGTSLEVLQDGVTTTTSNTQHTRDFEQDIADYSQEWWPGN